MDELKSKCHGAEIYWESIEIDAWRHIDIEYCSKCKEHCEVEEKEDKKRVG